MKVLIVVEGGLVQDVITDAPGAVMIVDYDVLKVEAHPPRPAFEKQTGSSKALAQAIRDMQAAWPAQGAGAAKEAP